MRGALYRNAHYIFGAILLITFLSWGGLWFWQKSEVIERMERHLAALGAQAPLIYELRGFPNRYDFSFETLTLTLPGSITINAEQVEINNLAYQDQLEIWAFGGAVSIQTTHHFAKIEGDKFRASLEYSEDRASRLVVTAEDAQINFNAQIRHVDQLSFGFRQHSAPRFALRTIENGKNKEQAADNLDDLLTGYLQ